MDLKEVPLRFHQSFYLHEGKESVFCIQWIIKYGKCSALFIPFFNQVTVKQLNFDQLMN